MKRTTLSRREWTDLLLLVGGGIVLAIGTVVFRFAVPRLSVPLQYYQVQYTIGFLYLGVLILLLVNSNTQVGRIGLTLFVVVLSLGLLVPPSLDIVAVVSNLMYLVLVLMGGVLYYRFNDPSNMLLIVVALLFGFEFLLFGAGFTVLAFLETGIVSLLGGMVVLLVMFAGYARVLGHELDQVHDGRRITRYLGKVL